MINLFEQYSSKELDLEYSLNKAGYKNQTVVLNDDGYLQGHILSPIRFFLGYKKEEKRAPRFFNELDLPYYWEINGNNHHAEIMAGYKKKGNIIYSDSQGDYRAIKAVEWLNDEGRIRAIDLYNQLGYMFGRKTYSDGELTLTTYFNREMQEVILHNHITNVIQLNYQNKHFIFTDYTDFALFSLNEMKLDTKEIIYNSLGLPFFISNALKAREGDIDYNHILFWQEEHEEIPGNMNHILNASDSATKIIVVQNWKEFLKIKSQVAKDSKIKLRYLGYIFNFKKTFKYEKTALTLTNSDEIAYLEELVNLLPDVQFRIAAYTEMSSKLLDFGKKANVTLYPTINAQELEKLLDTSGIYLDINAGDEVDGILRRAFDYNLLEFGFIEMAHESRYIVNSNRFSKSEYPLMVSHIRNLTRSSKTYQHAIQNQQIAAGLSTIEEYRRILK